MRYVALLALLCILAGCAKKPAPTPVKAPKLPAPTVVTDNGFTRFPGVAFAFDVDTLKPQQVRNLTQLAPIACKSPVVVTGYASNERKHKTDHEAKAYNLALASRRAHAVAAVLATAGCISVTVAPYGETDKFGALDKNRRVTIK